MGFDTESKINFSKNDTHEQVCICVRVYSKELNNKGFDTDSKKYV